MVRYPVPIRRHRANEQTNPIEIGSVRCQPLVYMSLVGIIPTDDNDRFPPSDFERDPIIGFFNGIQPSLEIAMRIRPGNQNR